MRILLCAVDVFSSLGGGESFFQSYALASGHRFVSFYERSRPPEISPQVSLVRLGNEARFNATPEALRGLSCPRSGSLEEKGAEIALFFDMAAAVAGQHFDVVELPDYYPFGAFIFAALAHHKVSYGRLCVSMHGTLHAALSTNWGWSSSEDYDVLSIYDDLLFRAADTRYGIGKGYVDHWRDRTGLEVTLVDAVSVYKPRLGLLEACPAPAGPIAMTFVGRHDLIKGPDIFVELAARLPARFNSALEVIGPTVNRMGVDSRAQLEELGKRYGLAIRFGVLPFESLVQRLSDTRCAVVQPSRRDTYNLAALEAALIGRPVAVSSTCGVTHLFDSVPGLDHLTLDPTQLDASAERLSLWLDRYDEVAQNFAQAREVLLETRFGCAASEANGGPMQFVAAERAFALQVGSEFARRIDSGRDARELQRAGEVEELVGQAVRQSVGAVWRLPTIDADLGGLASLRREAAERRRPAGHQAGVLSGLGPHAKGRSRMSALRLAAKLERERGNVAGALCYDLRRARLSDFRDGRAVASLAEELAVGGFHREAEVLALVNGPEPGLSQWADGRQKLRWTADAGNVEHHQSIGTAQETPTISVICSVFNGRREAPSFLRNLRRALEAADCSFELILIDSNSSDDSREIILEHCNQWGGLLGRGLVDVITTERTESIQAAWNRGLSHARGEYVGFPGLDEAYPVGGLRRLLDMLRRSPDLNWVQGEALVFECDEQGEPQTEAMRYIRSNGDSLDTLFDSTRISFVGSLSRRSFLVQSGGFDDSFRGAGDTDFKMRNLGRFRVRNIDQVTGWFLNFPTARVTSSFMAEIEDFRAWYAYRRAPALEAVLTGVPDERVLDLLYRSLRHRKSFVAHESSDWMLAGELLKVLQKRQVPLEPSSRDLVDAVSDISSAFKLLYSIEPSLERGSSFGRSELAWTRRMLQGALSWPANAAAPVLDWDRDNSQEQHVVIWETYAKEVGQEPWNDPSLLAGVQDNAELLAACGSHSHEVNLEEAWRSGNLDQVFRLHRTAALDVAIPCDLFSEGALRDLRAYLDELSLTLPNASVVCFGRASKHFLERLGAQENLFFSGSLSELAPLLSAVACVVLPTHRHVAWLSDPLLAAEAAGVPALQLAASGPIELAMRDLAEASAALVVERHGKLTALSHAPETWLGWAPNVARFNWILRQTLELRRLVVSGEEWSGFLASAGTGWGKEIVDALLVARDAPMIRYYGALAEILRQLAPTPTLESALGLLASFAESGGEAGIEGNAEAESAESDSDEPEADLH